MYHLRITTDRVEGLAIAQAFVEKYKPKKFIFGYEEVEDNHHIHGHLEYDVVPNKENVSQFMKKHKIIGQAKYYHKNVVKTAKENMQYVAKDCDVIYHNIPADELEALQEAIKLVKADIAKDMREKLYERVIKHFDVNKRITLSTITVFIFEIYINEYNKESPMAHIKGYCLYICGKVPKWKYNLHLYARDIWNEKGVYVEHSSDDDQPDLCQ